MQAKTPAIVLMIAGLLCATPAIAQRSTLTPQEQRNKEVVQEFWRVVLQAGNIDKAGDYYAVDMVQHNPNVPSGLAGFIEFFSRIGIEVQPVEPTIRNEVVTTVDGDLVTIIRSTRVPEPGNESQTYEAFNFDTFRVRDGMIVEHWDAARKPTQ